MSEYQYYEFLAIDRPLSEQAMQELRAVSSRAVSSRAVLTATRFTNHYEWGNFKGDPRAWMERYFDAFLFYANWGTHELMKVSPPLARSGHGEAVLLRGSGLGTGQGRAYHP